ncbi:AAA family ATPase [Candidatus Saccharibacteria bacterium]|jgi:hypothetical protein|uniref:AAA family ATPase n=1 Tax=Candidatus Mycosynbacter amalyticus TaxID=2665156 RepID=A0A857MID3_9BACT|nr:AAA family ATPase [Candidatus Mycosynbacter amalyticus]MBP9668178.1 AAA family ATPase [Candidatus Saccharibacteria bacterium]MBP9985744.1 AAA family ATPase [Candidatus Saccharibacteria bacterium]QHN42316.1 AAA family ATPase [Candidatus Mycosynbacter amalyticus]
MTSPNRNRYKELWEKGTQTGQLRLSTERLSDLLLEEFPPEVWAIEGLIPAEGVTIISGSPGSFKTWLYMEMAVKVAQGESVFGHFPSKQMGVMVIDEESGRQRLQKRFKQMGASENTEIHFTSRIGYKMNHLYVDAIAKEAKEKEIGLVIFDSFTRFNNADENASGDMATLMDCYRQLADTGLAVLILHHNRKGVAGQSNPAMEMRGSSDILAAADCHIAVNRVGQSEFVRLTQTKNRDIWEPAPFELRFHENATEFEYVGEGKSSADRHNEQLKEIVEAVGLYPGLSKRQLVAQIKTDGFKGGDKKISDCLDELARTEMVRVLPGGRNSYKYYLPSDEPSAAKND